MKPGTRNIIHPTLTIYVTIQPGITITTGR